MPIQYHSAVNHLRTAIKQVMDKLSKSEWHTSEERAALDAMEDAYNDTAVLQVDNNAQQMVEQIREVMWPADDLGQDWSADTLDEIAEILSPRFPPTESMLTPEAEQQVIEQSSHSYEPKGNGNGE